MTGAPRPAPLPAERRDEQARALPGTLLGLELDPDMDPGTAPRLPGTEE